MSRPSDAPPLGGGEDAAGMPRLGDLRAAVALLTPLPPRHVDPHGPACSRATLFFPIVGGGIGGILLATNWLLGRGTPAALTAAILVGTWEILTAGRTLRAWGRIGEWGVERPMTSPAGAAAMAGVVLIKTIGLAVQGSARPVALLFAPMLGRWSMVVLATGARDAAGPARKFNPAITFREFALTSVLTLAATLTLGEAFGVVLVVAVAGWTLVLRLLSHRWAGGVSWRFLHAAAASVEIVVVVLCGGLVNYS